MKIHTRSISVDAEPYVIAELGVNHNGSPATALELTRAAATAGADAIKLQLFHADLLMSAASDLATYQKNAGEVDPRAMLKRLELSIEDMAPVVELAHELGMHALVTVFSVELVELAQRLPWDAYKTASPDIVHRPLLESLAATQRPMIVSTGASTLVEVGRALNWLRSRRGELAVLQCVSSYPTPDDAAELGGILAIKDIFDGPVGYSDHTSGTGVVEDAVRLGACVLEKHLTLDKQATGPDHAASLNPEEFAAYCRAAHNARNPESAPRTKSTNKTRRGGTHAAGGASNGAGTGTLPAKTARSGVPLEKYPAHKRVTAIEEDVRRVSRQSIVFKHGLPAGHVVTREDVTFKRPGTGLGPWELERVLGARLNRSVAGDFPVMAEDIGG